MTTVLVALLTHLGTLGGVFCSPRGLKILFALNATVACVLLLYATTRARYILAAADWPYLGLVAFELLVLTGALWAFREGRLAILGSYVAFGIHVCAILALLVFVCVVKFDRMI